MQHQQQRSSMPTLNFAQGGAVVLHHQAAPGQTPMYTVYANQPTVNGTAVLAQNPAFNQIPPFRANLPPPSHPPGMPNTYPTGAYTTDMMPPTAAYANYQPAYYATGPTFQPYISTTYNAPPAIFANGNNQNYTFQQAPAGYPGPSAIELQAIPAMPTQHQHQQQQQGVVAMPSNGSNVSMGNLPISQPPHQQGPSQQPPQPPRQKKILAVIDPVSGKDQLEDIKAQKEELERSAGPPSHYPGAWKPPADQLHNFQSQASISALPTGAYASEQRPSRSGSGTPHVEQPIVHSTSSRSISRGPSPAPEKPKQPQAPDTIFEFYTQFGQQLAKGQLDQATSDSGIQSTNRDDADLMPPPSSIPLRPPSRTSSRQSSSRTPPPTPPPPVPSHVHSTKASTVAPVEYVAGHSFPSSSAISERKPTDILGKQEIQFGWLDTSGGEKSMDAADIENTSQEFCSTPIKQQPPSPNVRLGRDSGRRSDNAPKSPRDRNHQQPFLNGNQSGEKIKFTANDVSASNFPGSEQDLDDGELKKKATTTIEDKAAVLALVNELKQLEAPEGKRCYNHEFMVVARKLPSSNVRPPFKTETWSKDNREEVFDLGRPATQSKNDNARRPMPSASAGFVPGWMVGGGVPMDMSRKGYPGRPSDPKIKTKKFGGPNKPPPMVIARPSIDVELKTTENAWKPTSLTKGDGTSDPDQVETKKLFKEVRGLLNKITPQTFAELSSEFLAIEPRMNTVERAVGVVEIVFQKAIDEPAFCTMYSDLYDKMTKHQLYKQPPPTKGSTNAPNKTSFRYILLNKCQNEFERDKKTESTRQERESAIATAETSEQKKQLQDQLDEYVTKEKRRTMGNMRFIGELYLKNMLTSRIMHLCVMQLISKTDDEMLECLCKLLTTIGQRLDTDCEKDPALNAQCNGYYVRLQELSYTVNSRVRFMILDLLDLRANSWTPRRKVEGPKSIQQLHNDAAQEKFQQQQQLLQDEKKKQDYGNQQHDRRRGVPNRNSYGTPERQEHVVRDNKNDRGVSGRADRDQNRQGGRGGASASHQQQSADLSRQAKAPALSQHLGNPDSDVRLGPAKNAWNKQKVPPSAPRPSDAPQTKVSNRFAHLPRGEGVGGSAPGSRDSSQTRQDETLGSGQTSRKSSTSTVPKHAHLEERSSSSVDAGNIENVGKQDSELDSTPSTSAKPSSENPEVATAKLKHYSVELIDELVDSGSFAEAVSLVNEKSEVTDQIIFHALNHVVEKKEKHKRSMGGLIAHLYALDQRRKGVLDGLCSFVDYAIEDGMVEDVPLLWSYVGEILGSALLMADTLTDIPLTDFQDVFHKVGKRNGLKILAQTLKTVKETNEERSIERWHSIADRLPDFGFDSTPDSDQLSQLGLEFLLMAPSTVDASSGGDPESAEEVQTSVDAPSPLPSSAISDAPAQSADGSLASLVLHSSELDPVLVDVERFVKMGDTVDVDGLMNLVEKSGRLSGDADAGSINMMGALVKALCSKLLVADENDDNIDVDADEFERCSKVFVRFATTKPQLEMKVLDTLADFCNSKNNPKGLFVKLLTILQERQGVSLEAFREWWQLREDTLPAMIQSNGEVKAFFSRITVITASDAGSESDQGE